MKYLLPLLALSLLALPAFADKVELEGSISCAKCTLHHEGVTECQNVLVVDHEDETQTLYYLADNEVNTSFGEVCTGAPMVTVSGETSLDGETNWLTASEIIRLDAPAESDESADTGK